MRLLQKKACIHPGLTALASLQVATHAPVPRNSIGRVQMANSHGGGGASNNPGNFANDREKAARAGHQGGTHQGKENNPGNFASDREKASEAGHLGGTHQGKENNPGNFASDRKKASEAGRKGGQH
jgi:general stress protein YciG